MAAPVLVTGLAAFETDDVRRVTGHAPTTLAEFAHREREVWMRP